jgi:hypothetical protein
MMIDSNTYVRLKILLLIPFSTLLFTACGSYQQSSYYDNDGIYGDTEPIYRPQENNSTSRNTVPQQQTTTQQTTTQNNDAVLYENYFGQKAQQYEQMLNNTEEVFTDIDGYTSLTLQDSIDIATDINNRYENGYAGWGDNPSTTSINIYDNSWGWGWGGLGWNNWGWGLGWNNWGWGPGWNNWGWGLGWNNWGWALDGIIGAGALDGITGAGALDGTIGAGEASMVPDGHGMAAGAETMPEPTAEEVFMVEIRLPADQEGLE